MDQLKLITTLQRGKPWLIGAAVLVIAVLLVHTLRGLLLEFSYSDLLEAIRATSGSALGLALLATLVSFLALTGYDASSLRYKCAVKMRSIRERGERGNDGEVA